MFRLSRPIVRSITGLMSLLTCLLLCTHLASGTPLDRRQAGASPSSTLSSAAAASTTDPQTTGFPTLQSLTATSSEPGSSGSFTSVSQSGISTPLNLNASSSNTVFHSVLASTTSKTSTPSPTAANNATNGTVTVHSNPLPLNPRITPALSIAGVVLMVSGSAYVLIGIKNRSTQIFLSSAYLTSFSITVLIVYVMSPPISNAIQGAYFVAAFMTGVLFGAGSLIFPEVTEGLGCLLGGVCLSMWLLVLKPGGILTGTVGKIVFVLVFGVAVWSLSFFRRTRPYGLIGATSFSGATAVVLGIDCFCRAGLKEFWLYIWNLNDNLFPLNTKTYPITRGMQVEIATIVLLSVVGVISQLKLWRVIKDRREKKDTEQRDADRRKSAMEEAMGRFLEARTDREKAQWERIYGPQWNNVYSDHVRGSRSTLIDPATDMANDNRKSWIGVRELTPAGSAAVGVEMNRQTLTRADHNSTSRSKRQSAVTVHTIPEDDETQADASASTTDVQSTSSADDEPNHQLTSSQHKDDTAPSISPLPFAIPKNASTNAASARASATGQTHPDSNLQLSKKRKSDSSTLRRLSGQTGMAPLMSRSEEALVVPEAHHIRASSIVATLNDEPGELDIQSVHSEADQGSNGHDRGLIPGATPPTGQESSSRLSYLSNSPPSPAALSVEFDPEELARPITEISKLSLKPPNGSNTPGGSTSSSGPSGDSDAARSPTAISVDAKGSTPSPADVLSTESLTKGALVRVPSQVSNVVMTYRTNEWAKHISVAEAPVEDRISSILGEDEVEAPVQLVETPAPVRMEELGQTPMSVEATIKGPTSSKSAQVVTRSDKRHSTVRRPPETHLAPARVTVDDKKDVPSLHRSLSDQTLAAAPAITIRPPTSAGGQYTSLPPRFKRSSTSPGVEHALPTTIDENAETHFSPSSSPPTSPGPSAILPLPADRSSISRPTLATQQSDANGAPLVRPASSQSLSNPVLSRATSQIYQQAIASTSDTRLSASRDSRQPERRTSTFVPGKRDTMLADWQGSLSRENSMAAIPQVTLDQRRAEMMLERRQSQQSKQREEVSQQYREKVTEQAMRTTDMQALHREAMRKMQAKANKHI